MSANTVMFHIQEKGYLNGRLSKPFFFFLRKTWLPFMTEHTYTLTAQESKEFVPSNVFKKTADCITKSSDYISIGKIG